jgi:hypothetical protein
METKFLGRISPSDQNLNENQPGSILNSVRTLRTIAGPKED